MTLAVLPRNSYYDIELDNEICQIMEGAKGNDEPMDLTLFKVLDLSDDDKEAMARSDDLANLQKIDEAIAYCDAVLKGLHPEIAPSDLEVSVWEAEFKDEENVKIVTELQLCLVSKFQKFFCEIKRS